MGFFKFLKRDKSQGNEAELDLPPAPPPLEGFEDDKDINMPEFPQISAPKDDDFKFDFLEDDKTPEMGKDDGFPELPSFEDLDISQHSSEPTQAPAASFRKQEQLGVQVPFASAPMPRPLPVFNQPAQQYAPDLGSSQPANQAPPSVQPLQELKHRGAERIVRSGESLYVRVDKFKIALDYINVIRSDLRKSEVDLMKLESLKHEKDKSFDSFKLSLDDLQKKLIFVDKTLFKGE